MDGWTLDQLGERFSQERAPWLYFTQLGLRTRRATAMLDIQSGTGEILAALPKRPSRLVATEGFAPNIPVAIQNLVRLGIAVVTTASTDPRLPFRGGSFDLVASRHRLHTGAAREEWNEIARVLPPGGILFSQQVGPYSMRDLREFMLGFAPASTGDPAWARQYAEDAGLTVVGLRTARPENVF